MVNVTATDFKSLINDAGLSDANAELLIDQAVNRLNIYGADLPNMTGTAGTKTLSCESNQAGAIYEAARLVYHGYYKGQEAGIGISGLSISTQNMLNNPTVEAVIEKLAKQLVDFDVEVG